jgi:hypothetical protein
MALHGLSATHKRGMPLEFSKFNIRKPLVGMTRPSRLLGSYLGKRKRNDDVTYTILREGSAILREGSSLRDYLR